MTKLCKQSMHRFNSVIKGSGIRFVFSSMLFKENDRRRKCTSPNIRSHVLATKTHMRWYIHIVSAEDFQFTNHNPHFFRNVQVSCFVHGLWHIRTGPEVIKKNFMLSTAEHGILNNHKYKKYQDIQLVLGSDNPRMLFCCS